MYTSKNDSNKVRYLISRRMHNSIFFLKPSSHPKFFLINNSIVIIIGIDPSNPLKSKSISNNICFVSILHPINNLNISISTFLLRLINGLNNNSNTTLIIRIFCIITIQITNSLLCCMLLLNPIFYEILDLCNVHKLNIIYVTILLCFYHHARRNTFVAHCFWIWLVILALFVHFITDLLWWKAVMAFYLRWVNTLAF